MHTFAIALAAAVVLAFAAKLIVERLDSDRKREIKNSVNRFFAWLEDRGVVKKVPGFERYCYCDYPELRVLEDHYKVIREECEALLPDRETRVPMSALGGSYTAGGIHTAAWSVLMFKSGAFIEENCRLCPRTVALLREIPGVYTAFFSVLDPRENIEAHFGYYKGFLRYHLGVVIPYDNANGECYIRVNSDPQVNRARQRDRIAEGATYHWRNGEGVMFDDTFLHDAHNESDRARVVLFVDVRRKMPLYLHWLNVLFLFIAHHEKSVKKIRRNAVVGARPTRDQA